MHAMVLDRAQTPLVMRERVLPAPGAGEVLIEIAACGVCRTDLHVVDGELPDPALPLVPGHEIVGRVAALGTGVAGLGLGERVGVPWLGFTCGVCPYCSAERENLCDNPRFPGSISPAFPPTRFCKPLADVRFAPKAAELLRRREMSRSANSRHRGARLSGLATGYRHFTA
jgi:propanol-preferring alcohol dehydrogenase